jgi:hypothetical protein
MDINEKILFPVLVGVFSAVIGGLILKYTPDFRINFKSNFNKIYEITGELISRVFRKKDKNNEIIDQHNDIFGIRWVWKRDHEGAPIHLRSICPNCDNRITPIVKGYGSATCFTCKHCDYNPEPIPYPPELIVEKVKEKILKLN